MLTGSRIRILAGLRGKVPDLAHEVHQGIVCKQRLGSKVRWPGMDRDVKSLCKKCKSCQLLSGCDPPTPLVKTIRCQRVFGGLAVQICYDLGTKDN